MNDPQEFPIDACILRRKSHAGDDCIRRAVLPIPHLCSSFTPSSPMKPTLQLQTMLVFRFSIPLFLTLCLFSLNSLRAQSPLPDAFNPGAGGGSLPGVHLMAVQSDGKILVGGSFTNLGGQVRTNFGRLNANGTLDSTFKPGLSGYVNSIVLQADGKILVGGSFTTLSGQISSNLVRLHPDGALDSTFVGPSMEGYLGGSVSSLLLQSDGKILVGGSFTNLGGQPRESLGRLNADGTLDNSFSPASGDAVSSLALQADGKILVGGYFNTLAGQPRNYLGRLHADGTLDNSFNAGTDSAVQCLTVQGDGKILLGGWFEFIGGERRAYIGRLNEDGTLDNSFNPVASGWVRSLMLQADGKIVLGGDFGTLNGQPRAYIGRLLASGALDGTFNPGAGNIVYSLGMQADGKILVGGAFTTMGGQPRNRIARLNNTGSATQTLGYDGTTITWLRGDTSPEVWRTTFEYSTDGFAWTDLGTGARIAGGWQLTGAFLPPVVTLRARGQVAGGINNASGWFVEGYYGVPIIITQPTSRTNIAGTAASFTLLAGGTGAMNIRWLKNGVPLVNQGNTAGANTATLTLSQAFKADEASYTAVLSNSFGSRTSLVALLTVIDPFITQHPVGVIRNPGESATFNVAAVGTPPLSYQWYHEGLAVPGAVGSSLVLSGLSGTDAGRYTAIVSIGQGSSATSAPAVLTVNLATLDNTFNPGASNGVATLAVQPDGKILVGGSFTNLGGQPRNYIGRLNTDGTLDSTFDPGANNQVISLALQPDGKILVGGSFTNLGGQPRNYVGRLHADGTLDNIFNPDANGGVNSLAVQPDGKILVGGSFTTLGGQPRDRIGRLHADGTLDGAFNPGAGNIVFSLAVQPGGEILVGGSFTTLGGQPRDRIGRLHADGTLDGAFNPGAGNIVFSLAVQPDGKILTAGRFTSLGGQPRRCIGRLHADGILDSTFDPGTSNSGPVQVFALAVQVDGKILVGGPFNTLGGQQRSGIGRLHADGTLDGTFNPGATLNVSALAVQADGKILVGGTFTTLGGQPRDRIARLNNTGPATQSLSLDGATIIWLRGGTGPEVWRTTFEHSSDGSDWTLLGTSERIPGGWQLNGVALPPDGILRASGYFAAGQNNASGGIVETILNLTSPIRLQLIRDGSTAVLSWIGGQAPYKVQQTTDLSQIDSWQDLGLPVQGNSISLPIGPGSVFLRVRGQ